MDRDRGFGSPRRALVAWRLHEAAQRTRSVEEAEAILKKLIDLYNQEHDPQILAYIVYVEGRIRDLRLEELRECMKSALMLLKESNKDIIEILKGAAKRGKRIGYEYETVAI